jgi:glycerophosphoryl diester phosphodiesterase
MIHIAHRGCIERENTIQGIIDAFNHFPYVEIDVRYNTKRQLVLCHDREKRNLENELLEDLLKHDEPMHLMIDIKAFGIESAIQLGNDVVKMITQYSNHLYDLCSFNEYCVQEMIRFRKENKLTMFHIGVISSGVSIGMFNDLSIDFVSFNYDIIHEEIVDRLRKQNIKVYAWVCNDEMIKKDMEYKYKIDGIIYDYHSGLNLL